MPIVLRDRAFLRSLADAVFYALEAKNASVQPIEQRHARSSIISSAISLECAANCCLAALDVSRKLQAELDKMPVLAKFEVVAELNSGEIDRGAAPVQKVQELVGVRNSFVHPKSKSIPMEVGPREDRGTHWAVNFAFDADPSTILKIDRSAMFWFARDARSALSAVVDFFNYFFCSACDFDSKETLGILCPLVELPNKTAFVFHQEIFQEDVERLSDLEIENRFLDFDAIPGIASSPSAES